MESKDIIYNENNIANEIESSEEIDSENEKLIIVTGFDIFLGHEAVNASWEAVRILPSHLKLNGFKYKIEKKLVQVEYEKVDKIVKEIWEENPELVVHVGVSSSCRSVLLEKLAYNNKFNRFDYAKKRLESPTVCLDNNGHCERICTKLDIKRISHKVNTLCGPNATEVSKDVGNYLCGYIYLMSLDQNAERTLFVHVPKIGEPIETEEAKEIVVKIIEQCIKQIQLQQADKLNCA